jgi:hypothetical protein
VRFTLNDPDAPGVRVVPAHALAADLPRRAETLDMGQDTARVELPGALPAGRRAIQVRLSDGLEVGQAQVCATRGASCDQPVLPLCPPHRLRVTPPAPYAR